MAIFGLGGDADKSAADVSAEVALEQGYGGQSMVAPLRRVIVQEPAPPASDNDWQSFGYTSPVNHEATLAEHQAFRELLAGEGIEVITQSAAGPGELDSIFVYDTSILTDGGAVLTNPGKELRRTEVDRAAALYGELGVPVIGRIEGPGILEGGDTFWIDANTMAVGLGYRTNQWGIDQLKIFLQTNDIDLIPVVLPHWRGPNECLHLLSLISPIAERTAVVHSPLISTPFMQVLNELDWTLIEIPDEEFDTQGTNVLALAPNRVLVLRENVGTIRALEAAGVDVLTYTGDHISHNRQGGPTCLTKPLLRDAAPQE
jgi:N-dimethylarginine dimethylaminohydrolase